MFNSSKISVHTATKSFLTSHANIEPSSRHLRDTTSTFRWRQSDREAFSLLNVNNDAPSSNDTRKSTSLSGRSSLRAHEPKTQSFLALCFLAIAYISSRFARISSSMHIFSTRRPTKRGGAVATSSFAKATEDRERNPPTTRVICTPRHLGAETERSVANRLRNHKQKFRSLLLCRENSTRNKSYPPVPAVSREISMRNKS